MELCTDIPILEIKQIKNNIKTGKLNPKDAKVILAKSLITMYHNESNAQKAEDAFIKIFQKKQVPEEISEVGGIEGSKLMDILVENKVLISKGEFRRLVEEGAITELTRGEKIKDPNFIPEKGMRFKIGKMKFVKIK